MASIETLQCVARGVPRRSLSLPERGQRAQDIYFVSCTTKLSGYSVTCLGRAQWFSGQLTAYIHPTIYLLQGHSAEYAIRSNQQTLFPCSADYERDWPPRSVGFYGLATKTLNVRNKEVLSLQPKLWSHLLNVLTFSPLTGGGSEGLDASIFFFKQ